jgi:hypothetical protein
VTVASGAIARPGERQRAGRGTLAPSRGIGPADQTATLLRLESKLDRLLAILEAPPADPADADLLAAMWTAIGSSTFTATACLARVAVAGDVDLGEALRRADVTTGQELGTLLRRLEGRVLNGCCVRRVDVSRAGVVWRVSRVEPREPREG